MRIVVLALVSGGMLLVGATGNAQAAMITLDFDTAATGSNIIGSPLVSPLGTITASGAIQLGDTGNFFDDPDTNAAGASGDAIGSNVGQQFAVLSFDFDVSDIMFVYGGNFGGIDVEVLNSSAVVVDSFSQADTSGGQPAGPVTLSGLGIRTLRWTDSDGGSFFLDRQRQDNFHCSPRTHIPRAARHGRRRTRRLPHSPEAAVGCVTSAVQLDSRDGRPKGRPFSIDHAQESTSKGRTKPFWRCVAVLRLRFTTPWAADRLAVWWLRRLRTGWQSGRSVRGAGCRGTRPRSSVG